MEDLKGQDDSRRFRQTLRTSDKFRPSHCFPGRIVTATGPEGLRHCGDGDRRNRRLWTVYNAGLSAATIQRISISDEQTFNIILD